LVDDINLKNHYWNTENKVHKYKIEYDKERLKVSKMQETMRTDIFKDLKYYNWKVSTDEITKPQRFDFKNLTKNDRQIINNYYYDYFNIFNSLCDKIMD